MPKSGWHRVFHPLCGVDLVTLVRLIAQNGPPSSAGSLRLGIALASSIGRLPFTLAERAWTALAQHRPAPAAMRLLLEEVDRLPSHAITHVRFEELERDPLGQVERIYRSIKLDGHEVARPRIEAYLRRSRTTSSPPTRFQRRASDGSRKHGSHSSPALAITRPISSATPREQSAPATAA